MKILLGYMGCGKSSVAEYLHQKYKLTHCDLDNYIEGRENTSIPNIFKQKGEIYFRNIEHQYLKEILDANKFDVLALGGGTPCYAGNMNLINTLPNTMSFYLKVNLEILTHRLFDQRHQRPLIANVDNSLQLKDFIRKHLFEREFYYRQAQNILETSDMSTQEIGEKILKL